VVVGAPAANAPTALFTFAIAIGCALEKAVPHDSFSGCGFATVGWHCGVLPAAARNNLHLSDAPVVELAKPCRGLRTGDDRPGMARCHQTRPHRRYPGIDNDGILRRIAFLAGIAVQLQASARRRRHRGDLRHFGRRYGRTAEVEEDLRRTRGGIGIHADNIKVAGPLHQAMAPMLLDCVRQLVGDQSAPRLRIRRIRPAAEDDLVARGIGPRPDPAGGLGRRLAGMDPHPRQIRPKARLHEAPHSGIEPLSRLTQHLMHNVRRLRDGRLRRPVPFGTQWLRVLFLARCAFAADPLRSSADGDGGISHAHDLTGHVVRLVLKRIVNRPNLKLCLNDARPRRCGLPPVHCLTREQRDRAEAPGWVG